ncbi:MAG: HAMP domain-containing sensor histidine kinase, partial [Ignavibacteriaceae bacterium]
FAPINKIIKLANNISTTKLSERLNYKADADDELGKLRDTLNNLFNRLEEQIKRISSFTDNASHQLMTPITAINTELEYIIRNKKNGADCEQSLPVLKEQTERLISIIQSLLLLSKSEKDVLMQNSVFNLSSLINNQIRKRFEHEQIDYFIEDEIYVRGKEDYFLHALNNVVDNAIKYSPRNEKVEIRANRSLDRITITVADKGLGISDSEKEKIFERFYRSGEIEKLGIKGHGLGLSLAQAIVNVMNGSIAAKNNTPKGSVFIISLPPIDIT